MVLHAMQSSVRREKFDVIFVGSGLGSLTCARLLSRLYKKKVLLLERHYQLGGYTHTFKRPGGYHWDVGLHYIGQAGRGEDFERLFDMLSGGRISWQKMADPFERFVFPDFQFAVRSGAKKFQDDLIALFPNEREAIQQYFRDTAAAVKWLLVQGVRGAVPEPIRFVWGKALKKSEQLAKMSTGEYLNRHFSDLKLRALLASQWGDYGLPPSMSSFMIHAVVVQHYLGGGYYPVGTSESIADGIMEEIRLGGGEARINHEVTEICVSNKKVTGVKARRRRGDSWEEFEFEAPIVISGAGARTTYLKLLQGQERLLPFLPQLRAIEPGYANVTLFLGLSESPAKLGVVGENYWIYDTLDHDEVFKKRNELAEGKARFAYLSFPSMKDPKSRTHTAEVIAPIDHAVFKEWEGERWKKRGEEYENFKTTIADTLLDLVEKHVPNLRSIIAYRELATPLSTEHFTAHPKGEIYGIPATPARLEYDWLSAKTPIDGLYLTGVDVAAHGIGGAVMGGIISTIAVQGLSVLPKMARELYARRLT